MSDPTPVPTPRRTTPAVRLAAVTVVAAFVGAFAWLGHGGSGGEETTTPSATTTTTTVHAPPPGPMCPLRP